MIEDILFLLFISWSFIALVIFITLAIVQFVKKDNVKGLQHIKFASAVVLFVSYMLFVTYINPAKTYEDNEKLETEENDESIENKVAVDVSSSTKKDTELEEELKNDPEYQLFLAKRQLLQDIDSLFEENEKLIFEPGDYIQGDIPKGDYAFIGYVGVKHYSEKDQNGKIVANKNFDSFGYVHVHEIGNISNGGLLISESTFEKLNVNGSKEIFEILNFITDYTDSGYYKVGVDIPAGSYVLESNGDGYVAVMTGPVGNSKIVTNKNFNGKYQVKAVDGQYLKISRATITQQQ